MFFLLPYFYQEYLHLVFYCMLSNFYKQIENTHHKKRCNSLYAWIAL